MSLAVDKSTKKLRPEIQSVSRPHDWQQAVNAAYIRALGGTQVASAQSAGVSRRTVQAWEASHWWEDALAEAVDLWLRDVTAVARGQLLTHLVEGTADPLRVLERIDRRLASKARVEHVGDGGGAIVIKVGARRV